MRLSLLLLLKEPAAESRFETLRDHCKLIEPTPTRGAANPHVNCCASRLQLFRRIPQMVICRAVDGCCGLGTLVNRLCDCRGDVCQRSTNGGLCERHRVPRDAVRLRRFADELTGPKPKDAGILAALSVQLHSVVFNRGYARISRRHGSGAGDPSREPGYVAFLSSDTDDGSPRAHSPC